MMSSFVSDMPMVGLGTWKIPLQLTQTIVYQSIKELGVRHLDCACDYGNEVEVGKGINKAISEGIVKRGDLWITSKLWNTYHSPEHVEMAFQKSLTDLGLKYLDLYLIHFPISMKFVPFEDRYPPGWIHDPVGPDPKIEQVYIPLKDTWEAMEKLVTSQVTRYIGISNFNAQLIMELLSFCSVKPYTNQIELHPYLCQQVAPRLHSYNSFFFYFTLRTYHMSTLHQSLVDWCHSKGIKTTALSPLGSPSYIELNMDNGLGNGILDEPLIVAIAVAYSKTPAQILLRWNVQRGVSVIPKSSKIERIAENFAITDFSLSEKEVFILTLYYIHYILYTTCTIYTIVLT